MLNKKAKRHHTLWGGQGGGSGGHGCRYNRVSLNRHDRGTKREPWDYRKPQKRKKREFVAVKRYQWTGTTWVRID